MKKMSSQVVATIDEQLLVGFGEAISEDLALLRDLHAVELNAGTMAEIKASGFPACLRLRLESAQAREVFTLLDGAVETWGDAPDPATIDALAADFASIYLNHAYGAAPQESYWLDDDHLVMQKQMFQVRAIYSEFGLRVENWRRCPDDHLVHELGFLAQIFSLTSPWVAVHRAACFMDEHLLRWLDAFTSRVAMRCEMPFYAGLAMLTALYGEQLRNLLAQLLDEPRPSVEEIEARMTEKLEPVPVPVQFVPGAAPGW